MPLDTVRIGDRIYRKEGPGYPMFRIPLQELGPLRISDLPPHSSLTVVGLPDPPAPDCTFEVCAVNDGENLSLYGGVDVRTNVDVERREQHLRRVVERLRRKNILVEASVSSRHYQDGTHFGVGFSTGAIENREITVREAAKPLLSLFAALTQAEASVFICHSSEDKSVVRNLARFITERGPEVWFDEWEIRVGDSIVSKIDRGLESATHLVVVLSANSVTRPWVRKELSAALMRQLADRSIAVLPLRLDDAPVPAILADIKYADARGGLEAGFQDVLDAILHTGA